MPLRNLVWCLHRVDAPTSLEEATRLILEFKMSDPSNQMLDPTLFVRFFLSLCVYAESLISPDIYPHKKSWVSELITGLRPMWFQNMMKETNLSDIDELIRHYIKMAAQFRRLEIIKASATRLEST